MSLIKNEKGRYFEDECVKRGYSVVTDAGIFKYSPKAEVEALYESFDPLPMAQADAIMLINEAAANARLRYATDIPFQTEAYKTKYEDCAAFKAAGYPEQDIEQYKYVHARAVRFGVTGQVAADEIIAIRSFWDNKMFVIENTRDAGNEAVAACTDWTQCKAAAQGFIETLEAV